MTASYPTSAKSFSTKVDNVDLAQAAHMNDIQNEIAALETQLIAGGVNIATATPTANAVPKAGATGKLAVGWIPTNALIFSFGGVLTIASGSITVTNAFSNYQIDTEGAAATDDLTAIIGGTGGQLLILGGATYLRVTTVVKGTQLMLASNFVTTAAASRLTLMCIIAPSTWIEIARSNN